MDIWGPRPVVSSHATGQLLLLFILARTTAGTWINYTFVCISHKTRRNKDWLRSKRLQNNIAGLGGKVLSKYIPGLKGEIAAGWQKGGQKRCWSLFWEARDLFQSSQNMIELSLSFLLIYSGPQKMADQFSSALPKMAARPPGRGGEGLTLRSPCQVLVLFGNLHGFKSTFW